jgi:hypothetical protein
MYGRREVLVMGNAAAGAAAAAVCFLLLLSIYVGGARRGRISHDYLVL